MPIYRAAPASGATNSKMPESLDGDSTDGLAVVLYPFIFFCSVIVLLTHLGWVKDRPAIDERVEGGEKEQAVVGLQTITVAAVAPEGSGPAAPVAADSSYCWSDFAFLGPGRVVRYHCFLNLISGLLLAVSNVAVYRVVRSRLPLPSWPTSVAPTSRCTVAPSPTVRRLNMMPHSKSQVLVEHLRGTIVEKREPYSRSPGLIRPMSATAASVHGSRWGDGRGYYVAHRGGDCNNSSFPRLLARGGSRVRADRWLAEDARTPQRVL